MKTAAYTSTVLNNGKRVLAKVRGHGEPGALQYLGRAQAQSVAVKVGGELWRKADGRAWFIVVPDTFQG